MLQIGYADPLYWLLRTSVRLYSHLRAFARSLLRLLLLVDNLWEEYNWKTFFEVLFDERIPQVASTAFIPLKIIQVSW